MTLEELSAWLRASRPERDDLPQARGEVHAGGMDIERISRNSEAAIMQQKTRQRGQNPARV